jgi:hypothetical protein
MGVMGEVLVAEEQDLVLRHGLVQFVSLTVGDLSAQIDAKHLRADPQCDRPHIYAVISHERIL